MAVKSPRIRSLLRQADSVASSGKRAAAEQLYRQIIDEAPETAMEKATALNPEYGSVEEAAVDSTDIMPESGPAKSVDGQSAVTARSQPAEPDEATFVADHDHGSDVRAAQKPGMSETPAAVVEGTGEQGQTLYCANHPDRSTHLRCNRCGKPICSSCANPTPVGYRCPECIREQEDVFFTATPINYLLAALVALPLSLLAGWLATLLGFWSIFLAAFAGTLIGSVSFRAAGRRRGRWLPHLVTACVIIGAVLPALPYLLAILFGQFSLQLLFTGIYIVMATGATYYQMR
jgi:hypothetical protein